MGRARGLSPGTAPPLWSRGPSERLSGSPRGGGRAPPLPPPSRPGQARPQAAAAAAGLLPAGRYVAAIVAAGGRAGRGERRRGRAAAAARRRRLGESGGRRRGQRLLSQPSWEPQRLRRCSRAPSDPRRGVSFSAAAASSSAISAKGSREQAGGRAVAMAGPAGCAVAAAAAAAARCLLLAPLLFAGSRLGPGAAAAAANPQVSPPRRGVGRAAPLRSLDGASSLGWGGELPEVARQGPASNLPPPKKEGVVGRTPPGGEGAPLGGCGGRARGWRRCPPASSGSHLQHLPPPRSWHRLPLFPCGWAGWQRQARGGAGLLCREGGAPEVARGREDDHLWIPELRRAPGIGEGPLLVGRAWAAIRGTLPPESASLMIMGLPAE